MDDLPPRTHVTPGVIDNDTLLNIGRIIRACAEIEDLTKLFICQLAEIPEGKIVALLGRTPLSQQKKIALYLAKMRTDAAVSRYKQTFNSDFDRLFQTRNAIAHGVLLGITDIGYFAFLTAETVDPEEALTAVQIVRTYSADNLRQTAQAAEDWIPLMTEHLQLETLRDRSRDKPLERHHKGQPKAKKAAKPQHPPEA